VPVGFGIGSEPSNEGSETPRGPLSTWRRIVHHHEPDLSLADTERAECRRGHRMQVGLRRLAANRYFKGLSGDFEEYADANRRWPRSGPHCALHTARCTPYAAAWRSHVGNAAHPAFTGRPTADRCSFLGYPEPVVPLPAIPPSIQAREDF